MQDMRARYALPHRFYTHIYIIVFADLAFLCSHCVVVALLSRSTFRPMRNMFYQGIAMAGYSSGTGKLPGSFDRSVRIVVFV